MINKYHLKQETALTLYKSCVRPIYEYGSEIWDDASHYLTKKLDIIEHKCLTAALGVTRIAKITETNLEAQVMPLNFRRKKGH